MEFFFQPTETVTECVAITPDSNGAVTLAMKQNRLYTIESAPALTSLVLTVEDPETFLYSGLDFVTGNEGTALVYSTGWTWTGADCSSGYFAPTKNKSYRIAFEKNGNGVFAVVQGVR